MLLVVVAIVLAALAYRYVAPRLAPPGPEQRAKGLAALQTFFTICGIVLLAQWFLIDRPDAERLKFDQKVEAMPLGDDRALLVSEVTIANVGNHAAEFDDAPYAFFVQQVTPVGGVVMTDLDAPGTLGLPLVRPAYNWTTLAYGAARAPEGQYAVTNPRGLTAEILPGEEDTIYFRTAVPCSENLHVSVSARFSKARSLLQRVARTRLSNTFPPKLEPPPPLKWIKQTFVDLSDVCSKKEQAMKGPMIAAAAALLAAAGSPADAAPAGQPAQSTTTTTTTHSEVKKSKPAVKPREKPAPAQSTTNSTTTTTTTTETTGGGPSAAPTTGGPSAAPPPPSADTAGPAVEDPGTPPTPPTRPHAE